ncbi:hypothetical protein EYB45_10985 [Erythrobacteraceae bacterium CFH 75059]|uniref:hypothetical protein n=1 Tax=Qipengyuania thermophila TaxID=2509361 RepID=UPI0010228A7C|nr:hypothetical protein [Qipengyuania thermophila]TCD00710.1 hypothetical protein EYB45_10985 [Erythrobacteraceae bacterium CFH 75059]
MSGLFARYDRVRVITMPHRTDRQAAFAAQPIDPEAYVFVKAWNVRGRGLFRHAGSRSCFGTSLALMVAAGLEGRSLLLLQDDCQFLPGALDFAPSPVTDVLIGGGRWTPREGTPIPDLEGAHCLGFSRQALEVAVPFFARMLDPDVWFDPAVVGEHDPAVRPPIDGAISWLLRSHPELCPEWRQLAVQRRSASDITPAWYDRVPGLRQLADWVRA